MEAHIQKIIEMTRTLGGIILLLLAFTICVIVAIWGSNAIIEAFNF